MKKIAHKLPRLPTRCAIYARTATVKRAGKDNCIAQQVAACKRFAKRKVWIVRQDFIFTDSGKSGLRANLGLKDLLRTAAISPKSFDVLLCTAIDRIARDTGLAIRIYRALKKHGVKIFIAEHDDSDRCQLWPRFSTLNTEELPVDPTMGTITISHAPDGSVRLCRSDHRGMP